MSTTNQSAENILHNVQQVSLFLKSQGFKVSYGKIRDDIKRGALKPRRGGGFTEGTALAYATNYISRREVDTSKEADAPLGPRGQASETGSAERRTSADADLKEIAAMRARQAFAKEMGRYTETEVVEDELAARAKAFRLGLEKFGIDAAEKVASVFGGEGKAAAELAKRLGLEGEAQEAATAMIVDFALSRCSNFTRLWLVEVEALLDPYASDNWWTEEMRAAWERYEIHADVDVPAVEQGDQGGAYGN